MFKVYATTGTGTLERSAGFSHLEDAEHMFDVWNTLLPASSICMVCEGKRLRASWYADVPTWFEVQA